MSDKPKRILINVETQTEFKNRDICIAPGCTSPLPMGLSDTLCFNCQDTQNLHTQAAIDKWRAKTLGTPKKEGVNINDFLDNLITKRDAKKTKTASKAKLKESGPKVKVGVVDDKPITETLLQPESSNQVLSNI